ncbi:MAG: hypothetical protein EBZ50_09260 [Alphaproteobacteria bacterium]|jgi:hypothetical protein|nr:hypothetical protein [Alphaproteobacteria bacterium]
MLVLGSLVIFLLALGGIGYFTIQALRFAGNALNRRRPMRSRMIRGALAAASALAILGSSAAGFYGIGALWYNAQTKALSDAPQPAKAR